MDIERVGGYVDEVLGILLEEGGEGRNIQGGSAEYG